MGNQKQVWQSKLKVQGGFIIIRSGQSGPTGDMLDTTGHRLLDNEEPMTFVSRPEPGRVALPHEHDERLQRHLHDGELLRVEGGNFPKQPIMRFRMKRGKIS